MEERDKAIALLIRANRMLHTRGDGILPGGPFAQTIQGFINENNLNNG